MLSYLNPIGVGVLGWLVRIGGALGLRGEKSVLAIIMIISMIQSILKRYLKIRYRIHRYLKIRYRIQKCFKVRYKIQRSSIQRRLKI